MSAARRSSASAGQRPVQVAAHGSIKVLLVDDDATFARILSRSLGRHGYAVDTAQDGAAALALAPAAAYGYVLLDLMLRSESGLLLIEPLRLACPQAKIIVLTGYASIPTTVKALKLGASNLVAKPVGAREVIAAMNDESGATSVERPISLERLEWEHIQRVMADNNGNVSLAAKSLNMHRRSLQRKLRKRAPKA